MCSSQEYFIEDTCETLAWVSRAWPQLLDARTGADVMTFVTVFPGQPTYIRNPYLRYRLVEGLQQWLPEEERSFQRRRGGQNAALAALFEGDPLVTGQLVPTLLQLYTDIQHIDRAGQFYEKFRMRHTIADLLGMCVDKGVDFAHDNPSEYLFKQPEHHAAWARVANAEGGRGLYLVFCDMLVNDTIFLLDDAITRLPKVCLGFVTQTCVNLIITADPGNGVPHGGSGGMGRTGQRPPARARAGALHQQYAGSIKPQCTL